MQIEKLAIIGFLLILVGCTKNKEALNLDSCHFQTYIERFNQLDNELYTQNIPNDSAFAFLSKNIPLIEFPDKDIEETYYFRWWTYRKHIKHTPDGFVITEFLPKVPWSGKYNTINCPAAHHIYEGRWLRDSKFISNYVDFWLTKSGNGIRQYSFWIADAVLAFHSVHKNDAILEQQLPSLVKNYEAWEKIRRDSTNVLFWQDDAKEGMEVSASGRLLNEGISIGSMSSIRPSMNSYMFGDAMAISMLAESTGNPSISSDYSAKASMIKQAVQKRLWNSKLGFFTVLPRDYTATSQPIDIREAIGYVPWYFNLPDDKSTYSNAWKKVMDTTGFYAPYGLTVCERSHPFFAIDYTGHECQWNGPSWPFATTQTLKGLANLLNNYTNKGGVSKEDYYTLLLQYARSHSITYENGEQQKWIDENLNPFTGDWISRTRLKTWDNGTWSNEKGGVERGKDYNHSGFCDLVISDLIGLKPRLDHLIELNPLVPDTWDWFYLDNVFYQGKEVTVVWDRTGSKYNLGKGLLLFIDGQLKSRTAKLEKLVYNTDAE
ncbi:MGH1-like glycoside hydrolase domain-containing protein [Flagellimonas myxillae]|uniref:MGH1-like glycoside hydrolase domain-containing protein n=1 Tax=Flagellimonas myxillae TaxID=2942214 RepID=UPI00201E910C|nr:glycosyl hydrolase family 65 protein [Muricauda myxillae]MCL6265345.1 glycoside hydrolase [Muricauda myxillae]